MTIIAPINGDITDPEWAADITEQANVVQTRAYALGIVERGRRTTASSVSTGSEVSVLRVDAASVTNGRVYRITVPNVDLDTTTADDEILCNLRLASGGSAATTASGVVGSVRITADDASHTPQLPIIAYYLAVSDTTISVLQTITRANGAGNVRIFADSAHPNDIVIEDIGIDPGNTGVEL